MRAGATLAELSGTACVTKSPTSTEPSAYATRWAAALATRRAEDLYRTRATIDGPQGIEVDVAGERLLAFCSNDYLGLANHPDVRAAFVAGVERFGVGAGAAHLLSGHSTAHRALEEELAAFFGTERALVFSTGYMANLGIVAALATRHMTIFEDRLNHASLLDAARQSGARDGGARVHRYAHADTAQLGQRLAAARGDKFIISDGVFSMDGDLAPLPALVALARTHAALLLIDDAHGVGVLGAHGRGSFEHWQIPLGLPAIFMGTLGKAFGTFGAFVAGESVLIETLIQAARTYIYTTALPPALAEATRASLRCVRRETWRRETLRAHIAYFRAQAAGMGLTLLPSESPIQALVLGRAARAVAASAHLRRRGLWVPAIRPPTVPAGSARLRISLSAAHTRAHIDRLLAAFADLPA